MIESNKIIIDDMKKESNHMEEIKEDMSKTETSKKANEHLLKGTDSSKSRLKTGHDRAILPVYVKTRYSDLYIQSV